MANLTVEERRSLEDEISDLEIRLKDAKTRLSSNQEPDESSAALESGISHLLTALPPDVGFQTLHTLLILSDSALPLGSFAFSNGLESYLAHLRLANRAPAASAETFLHFLNLSLASISGTTLPFVLAGHRHPEQLPRLDNDLDASTPCTVARRASIAQGRALLALWDRSLRKQLSPLSDASDASIEALESFQQALRDSSRADPSKASSGPLELGFPASAHLPPLFGVLTRVLRLPLRTAAYLYLFSHARTVTSAGVRAGLLGPYQAQEILVRPELGASIGRLIDEGWDRAAEDAGQSVPAVDLWMGRHELLYSRIFNS